MAIEVLYVNFVIVENPDIPRNTLKNVAKSPSAILFQTDRKRLIIELV